MTSIASSGSPHSRGDEPVYPWQWLTVVGVVIAMMVAGAGWLYQKNGEWYVRATHDSARLSPVHTSESSADPAADSAVPVVQQTSAPPVESDPEFASESLDAIESTRVPPTQIDSGAESTPANRSRAAMPKRPSSIDKAPRRPNTYIIRRGDTLSAIATRVYGNGSQWSIISEANPDLDPKRLSVGHALMLPARPARSP